MCGNGRHRTSCRSPASPPTLTRITPSRGSTPARGCAAAASPPARGSRARAIGTSSLPTATTSSPAFELVRCELAGGRPIVAPLTRGYDRGAGALELGQLAVGSDADLEPAIAAAND